MPRNEDKPAERGYDMPIKELNNEALEKLSRVMKECGIDVGAEDCNGTPTVTFWIDGLAYQMEKRFVCHDDVALKIIR